MKKKNFKSLGAFLRGEVHKIGRREKLAEKVGRKEKLAEKVGRREIYPPVPPPFSSTCILTEN